MAKTIHCPNCKALLGLSSEDGKEIEVEVIKAAGKEKPDRDLILDAIGVTDSDPAGDDDDKK